MGKQKKRDCRTWCSFATCEGATASERASERERIEGDTTCIRFWEEEDEGSPPVLFRIRKCLWFRFFFHFRYPYLFLMRLIDLSLFLFSFQLNPFFFVIFFLISLFSIDLLKPFRNSFQFRCRSYVSGFARFPTVFLHLGPIEPKILVLLSYLGNWMGAVVSSDLRSRLGFTREKMNSFEHKGHGSFCVTFSFFFYDLTIFYCVNVGVWLKVAFFFSLLLNREKTIVLPNSIMYVWVLVAGILAFSQSMSGLV